MQTCIHLFKQKKHVCIFMSLFYRVGAYLHQMTLFTDIIVHEIERLGGERIGMVRLAEKLGENYSQVHRWKNGQQPKFNTAAAVIERLGGDMARALPGWSKAEGTADAPSVQILGQVQAGAFSQAGEALGEIHLDVSAWEKGPYQGLTYGDTSLVQIVGDSMEPRYTAGEFLVCRAPVDPTRLNDNTPCIFTGPDGSTFKLLRKSRDGVIIGQPLNPQHEIIVFNGRNVTVQLVVLGSIDLGYSKAARTLKKAGTIRGKL